MTSITVYDGANTIDGNKIYVENDGKGVFLDFGMNFANYNLYYQNFLRDRTNRGIYDLINLDLLPKLNIYREDLIPSNLDVSNYPRLDVNLMKSWVSDSGRYDLNFFFTNLIYLAFRQFFVGLSISDRDTNFPNLI